MDDPPTGVPKARSWHSNRVEFVELAPPLPPLFPITCTSDFVKVKVDKKEGGGFKVRPKLKLFDFLGDDDDE